MSGDEKSGAWHKISQVNLLAVEAVLRWAMLLRLTTEELSADRLTATGGGACSLRDLGETGRREAAGL